MHHLAAGMNGSVGTAGADHPDRLGGNLRQGALQRFLHGRHAGFLALPATIAGALVLDAEGDSGNASGSRFVYRYIFIFQLLMPIFFPHWIPKLCHESQ